VSALDVTVLGYPVRFEVRGQRAAETLVALRRAWGRCTALPVSPWFVDARPHVIQVAVLAEGEREVDATMVRAHGTGERPPELGTTSQLARHRVDSLLIAVTQEATLVGITANRGRLIMLHAAVLAAPGGQAVGFVAPSGTGKTTIASLLGREWGYLSDETLAVDADGSVVPYPKPLSVTRPALNLKLETSPDLLGLAVPPAECRLGGIVILDRRPSASIRSPAGAALHDIPLLEAVVELAGQASALDALSSPLRRLADLWCDAPLAGRLIYSEASAAAIFLDKQQPTSSVNESPVHIVVP
jgi:hypothetical protein